MLNKIEFQGEFIAPSKVLCVGRNYVAHIEELDNEVPDEMVVFFKPNSAISDQLVAHRGEVLHYESELCFLVESGRFCAVAFGFDLTKRALQSGLKAKGLPWERAKAFDGAAVFGDFVALPESIDALSLQMQIDQEITQQGGVSLMLHKPAEILAELQSFVSLVDGDIVMTGTPRGVGALQAGRRYTGSIYDGEQLLAQNTWQAQ